MKTLHHRQSGFYLIEALIVFLILSTGILAFSQLHAGLMGYTSLAKQQTEAAQIGRTKLESFHNFQCLTTGTCAYAYADIASGTSTQSGSNADYSLNWTVTNSAVPAYKMINLSISWTSQTGVAESMNLTTIVAATDPTISGKLFNVNGGTGNNQGDDDDEGDDGWHDNDDDDGDDSGGGGWHWHHGHGGGNH